MVLATLLSKDLSCKDWSMVQRTKGRLCRFSSHGRTTVMEGEGPMCRVTHLWFGVFGVVDLGPVVPVLGLLSLRVLDLHGGQEVPVLLQLARFYLLVVDPHLIGLVGVQDQRV